MVNLELYKVFHAVAKYGSLTRAAQELYISQPAVSQSIKQLESQLGVPLFNRTHKGMELSSSGGKLIAKKIEEALMLIESAENSISELKSTATGTVRIGATDSIFSHLIAEKLAQFNEKFPAVRLELLSSTTPETINQLKEGRCDVGFVNLPIDDPEIKFIGNVTLLTDIFVAGKKFENLKGKQIPLKALQDMPLLMIEDNTVHRNTIAAFTRNLGIELSPDLEGANWDLMVKLAAKGMGVGCVPREYCQEQLDSGELFELDVNPPLPVRGVGIVLSKYANASYALKQFIALFD